MADQKISQLSSGTNAQAGDLFVIARGASNFNLTTAQLFNAPSAAATFASLTVDTNTLFVDAVNNRVGVGTATPASGLHVASAVSSNVDLTMQAVSAGNAARLTFLRGASALFYAGLGAWTGGDLYEISNASGSRLTFDASGNLGLGVTPSAWGSGRALEIGRLGTAMWSFDVNETYYLSNAYFNSGLKYASNGTATQYLQYAGAHSWFTAPSGTADNAITFTTAMTLNASGNLALGTDNPGTALGRVFRINGAASGTNTGLIFSNALTDNGTAYSNSTQFTLGSLSSIPTVFITNNTERARITAAGNVVMGGSVALATTATDGFLYVPTCAGTPTGTPTAITGMAPIVVDTTNNKLYFYSNAAWRDAGP